MLTTMKTLERLCEVSYATLRRDVEKGRIPGPNLISGFRLGFDEVARQSIENFYKQHSKWKRTKGVTRD